MASDEDLYELAVAVSKTGDVNRLTKEVTDAEVALKKTIATAGGMAGGLAGMNAAVKAAAANLDSLRGQLQTAQKELAKLGSGRSNSARAFLELSRAAEDAQFGIAGVVNNIPGLVTALGGGAGVTAAASFAAIAVAQIVKNLDSLKGMATGSYLKDLSTQMAEYKKETTLTADQQERLAHWEDVRRRTGNQTGKPDQQQKQESDIDKVFREGPVAEINKGIDKNFGQKIRLDAEAKNPAAYGELEAANKALLEAERRRGIKNKTNPGSGDDLVREAQDRVNKAYEATNKAYGESRDAFRVDEIHRKEILAAATKNPDDFGSNGREFAKKLKEAYKSPEEKAEEAYEKQQKEFDEAQQNRMNADQAARDSKESADLHEWDTKTEPRRQQEQADNITKGINDYYDRTSKDTAESVLSAMPNPDDVNKPFGRDEEPPELADPALNKGKSRGWRKLQARREAARQQRADARLGFRDDDPAGKFLAGTADDQDFKAELRRRGLDANDPLMLHRVKMETEAQRQKIGQDEANQFGLGDWQAGLDSFNAKRAKRIADERIEKVREVRPELSGMLDGYAGTSMRAGYSEAEIGRSLYPKLSRQYGEDVARKMIDDATKNARQSIFSESMSEEMKGQKNASVINSNSGLRDSLQSAVSMDKRLEEMVKYQKESVVLQRQFLELNLGGLG